MPAPPQTRDASPLSIPRATTASTTATTTGRNLLEHISLKTVYNMKQTALKILHTFFTLQCNTHTRTRVYTHAKRGKGAAPEVVTVKIDVFEIFFIFEMNNQTSFDFLIVIQRSAERH